jgi:hypothetical protein
VSARPGACVPGWSDETRKRRRAVVFLNSDKNQGLVRNHWGSKKIPIKNIIVMTNKAPKSDFQHVKVLPLDKLNGYIQYFDDAETNNIFNYLNDETQ